MPVITSSLLCFSAASFLLSYLLCFRTQWVISMQIKFYALINWKVEPISMEREMRSTRVMGMVLFAFTVLAGAYYFLWMC